MPPPGAKLLVTARCRTKRRVADGTSLSRRRRARPHLHAPPPKRQRAAWPAMRAREEDRRGEHGLLLGYVRRAGSLYCLTLHLEPTTALAVRTSQLAATQAAGPNPSQSSQLATCQQGSHVVVACRTSAGRRCGQEARQRREVLREAQARLSLWTRRSVGMRPVESRSCAVCTGHAHRPPA